MIQRTSGQKISKVLYRFEQYYEQLDLIYIRRALYPTRAEYSFFSSGHEIFAKTDHILSHKPRLNKFKRILS